MEVQVGDGLAAFSAGIDDYPVAFDKMLLSGDLRSCGEQVPEENRLLGAGVRQRREVLPGNEQDMDG